MTTEEIKKAAREYTKSLEIGNCLMLQFGELEKYAKRDFVAGAKFANKIWQEKTRWIPVEEKLPELREYPYWVVAKNDKGDDYVIVNIRNEGFFEYLKSYFTHWKEIEL